MNDGEISALHFVTRQPVRVRWHEDKITAIEPAPPPLPKDVWIAPTLTDLQVNGYGSVDFHGDGPTREGLLTAARALERDGCGQILLTLTTSEWSVLTTKLKRIRDWRNQTPELRAAIAGWHIEGPFLSPISGFVGAHPPQWMINPTPTHIRELREITGSDALLLTMAAEQPGVLDIIPLAVSLGIRISLGHTNASADTIQAAVDAGATVFTHLGNGCPQALDRHDNILWRVFETPGLHPGLIPDKVHVSPALFRIIHRLIPHDRLWYTTDAVSPAGALPGRYTMLGKEFEVGTDQIVREPGKTNFAGSALRPLEGIFRATEMLNCPWQEAWLRYSKQPREMMGLDAQQLAVGKDASFCVLDFVQPQNPTVKTYIRGHLRSTLPAQAKMNSAGIIKN
ncbi:MAG: N-acetylglucosamine-6-phosphate deacetylase [Planctomycetota bacterium]